MKFKGVGRSGFGYNGGFYPKDGLQRNSFLKRREREDLQ